MRCQLCDHENASHLDICSLCGTQLSKESEDFEVFQEEVSPIVLESSEEGGGFNKSKLAIGVLVAFLLLLPWWMMADLLRAPQDVQESIEHFELAKESYLEDAEKWKLQKNMVLMAMEENRDNPELAKPDLTFSKIPLEVLMAYLYDDLDWGNHRLQDVRLFPKEGGKGTCIVLSKTEGKMWPLTVTSSLEITFRFEQGRLITEFSRLRRGKREVSPAMAWELFGTELGTLDPFLGFAGGIHTLQIGEAQEEESSIINTSPFHISWDFSQRPPPSGA